jgi:hypothetical protein
MKYASGRLAGPVIIQLQDSAIYSEFSLKINYKQYGVNIISIIPSLRLGEGYGEGE